MNIDLKTAFLEHCVELHLQGKAPFRFLEEAFAVRNDLDDHKDRLQDLFKEIQKSSKERILFLECIIAMYLISPSNIEDLKWSYKNLYKQGSFSVLETETRH